MLDALDSWGLDCVASVVLPVVQRECGELCTAHLSDTAPETIVIEYPKSFQTEYVKSAILLEIGPKEGLTRDYAKMQATMLPDIAPALGDILQELQRLESEVNALAPLALDIRNYPDMQP